MFERFTEKAINIIATAQKEAADSQTYKIYPEHILLGILETKNNICSRLLTYGGMKADTFREYVYSKYKNISHEFKHTNIAFSIESQKIIKLASELATKRTKSYIRPEHILLALIMTGEKADPSIAEDFKDYISDIQKLKQTLLTLIAKNDKRNLLHPELERKEPKAQVVSSFFLLDQKEPKNQG